MSSTLATILATQLGLPEMVATAVSEAIEAKGMEGGAARAREISREAGFAAGFEGANALNQQAVDNIADLRTRDGVAVLRSLEAPLNGLGDDAPAMAELFGISPRGLALDIAQPLRLRLSTPVLVVDKPFAIRGAMPSYSESQGTAITIATPDAFDIRNSDGFTLARAYIKGTGAALTEGSLLSFSPSLSPSNSGMVVLEDLRIESGWNAITFRKVFQVQLRGVRFAGFAGDYVIGVNGVSDDQQGNAFEFMGCSLGAVQGSNTDLVVFDGGSGSATFVGTAMNFGRHGIVSRNSTLGPLRTIASVSQSPGPDGGVRVVTTGNHGFASDNFVIIDGVSPPDVVNGTWQVTVVNSTTFDLVDAEWVENDYSGGTAQKTEGRDPGFLYFADRGMENLKGDCFRLERGGKLLVSNSYFSTDGDGHIVNQWATYLGRVKFSNCDLRAAGKHGLRIMRGNISLDGCDIVNNGRVYVDVETYTVSAIGDNGAGLYRITTSAPHGYRSGDRVRLSRCGLATGGWPITVIDATRFDLQGSVFAAGQPTGGKSWRYYHGVKGASNNGSGGIRLQIPGHKFDDGEWIHTSAIGGVSKANGDFRIAVIDADHVDLVMGTDKKVPSFAGAYTTGGYAQRCSAQVYIGPNADGVSITNGLLGTSTQGINRARYAVIIEPGAKNVTINADITQDAKSRILNLSDESTISITNRRDLLQPVTSNTTMKFNGPIALAETVANEYIGQSNSVGLLATPSLTTVQLYDNIRFRNSTRPVGIDASADYSQTEPSIESDNASYGEVGVVACGMFAREKFQDYTGILVADQDARRLDYSSGRGGASLAQLASGTYYNDWKTQLGSAPRPVVLFSTKLVHGEADQSSGLSRAAYASGLLSWQTNRAAYVRTTYKQGFDPIMFLSQPASHLYYHFAGGYPSAPITPDIALAMWDVSLTNRDMPIALSRYIFDYTDGGAHENNFSKEMLGKILGRAEAKYMQARLEGRADPVIAVVPRAIHWDYKVAEVAVTVPYGRIRKKTTWVSDTPNGGWDLYDASHTLIETGITSVEAVADRIRVRFADDPPVGYWLKYAHGRAETASGRANGPRGCFCDMEGDVDYYVDGAGVLRELDNYLIVCAFQRTADGWQAFDVQQPVVPTPPAADNSRRTANTAWVRGYAQPLDADLTAIAALAFSANKALKWDASGNPALVDDIVGGTFTPGISCDTPGNLDLAGVVASGFYTKKDKVVEVTIGITFTPTYSTASGNLRITGLPFVAESNTVEGLLSPRTISSSVTWPSSATQLFANVVSGQSYCNVVGHKSAGSTATLAITGLTSGVATTLRFTGRYRVP